MVKRKIKVVLAVSFLTAMYLYLTSHRLAAILVLAIPVAIYISVAEQSRNSFLSFDADSIQASKYNMMLLSTSDVKLRDLVKKASELQDSYCQLLKNLDTVSFYCDTGLTDSIYEEIVKDSKRAFNVSFNNFYCKIKLIIASKSYSEKEYMSMIKNLSDCKDQVTALKEFEDAIVDGHFARTGDIERLADYTESMKTVNTRYYRK